MLEAMMFLVLVYLTTPHITSCSPQVLSRNPACQLEIIKTFEDYEYMMEGDIMIAGVLTVNSFIVSFSYTIDFYDGMLCVGEPVPNYSCVGKRNIAGFIGDLSSETTVPIARILNVYGFAQISYGATDPLLSDRVAFPYFFRMVQNDHGHYLALSNLLKYFEWRWIGIIQFNDNSGEKELQLLTNYLTMEGICVEFTIKLSSYINDTPMYKMHKKIIQKSSTSVIILCGTASVNFVGIFRNLTDVFRKKTLIVSSGVAVNHIIMDYHLEIFHGSLGLAQDWRYSPDCPEMRSFLQSLHQVKYPEDKLLEDIWMQYHLCLSEDPSKNDLYEKLYRITLHNCTGQHNITVVVNIDSKLYFPRVHAAVHIMAEALHEMQMSLSKKSCENNTAGHHYTHKVKHILAFT
ncbi:hypothetical protein XELAEV_18004643mg [Xenopus laevis]|uniref:Receptor ligand binding region domain-containing protein n=1 Tax=Xenopus laevis TaxID=8355 RepID=A0A974BR07_XENLA|nr:hypothetical protein XELAEV_18004643mg [Xenopus laevis]